MNYKEYSDKEFYYSWEEEHPKLYNFKCNAAQFLFLFQKKAI